MKRSSYLVLRLTFLYALGASAWVLLSDRLLAGLGIAATQVAFWQSAKGLIFVALTSALLYGLLRYYEQFRSEQQSRYQGLFNNSQAVMLLVDGVTQQVIDANPAAGRYYGLKTRELVGMVWTGLEPPDANPDLGATHHYEARHRHADGSLRDVEVYCSELTLNGSPARHIIVHDISDRKEAEAESRLLSAALEAAANGVAITDTRGHVVWVNPAFSEMTGYRAAEVTGRKLNFLRSGYQPDAFYQTLWETIQSGEVWHGELINRRKDGSVYTEEQTITPVRDAHGEISHHIGIKQDISDRKAWEAHVTDLNSSLNTRLERLSALYENNQTITASTDLRLTLNLLLTQVLDQLGVDAAQVLLLNDTDYTLERASSRGFRGQMLTNKRLALSEQEAGRVAVSQKPRHIEDLRTQPHTLPKEFLDKEAFVAYWGVPLVARGKLQGVLELFHRTSQNRDREWYDFLDALATQAAIALDNATLVSTLQQSNLELALAYDANIEGWARALDLRDNETEGHSRRVTDLTVDLARYMGVDDDKLIHIRRGALLHDIGKMGVPDRILHKPGKLDDSEWALMRQHPVYALKLLKPIRFLRPALDIPHYHHERWDGSGYPEGLRGEEIPLAARMFAVIDVYDALTSDRPYRKAWSPERVRDYLQQEAGSHFDPQAVEAFIAMMDKRRAHNEGRAAAWVDPQERSQSYGKN